MAWSPAAGSTTPVTPSRLSSLKKACRLARFSASGRALMRANSAEKGPMPPNSLPVARPCASRSTVMPGGSAAPVSSPSTSIALVLTTA
ncbi:hypothetical protein D3C87_830940 [compost metagenome]